MYAKMIGSKIAEARKKTNMSQAVLAQHVFVSPQAVGKWERGESLPDIITLNQLTKILGIDLNHFSETGFKSTTGNIENVEQIEMAGSSKVPESQLLVNFNGSNLVESDFAGVTAHKRRFNGSALRRSNFAGADLSGSSFMGSDMAETNFDGTNLTDCTFSANTITDASFNSTIFVRTRFSASALDGAKFSNAALIEVRLTKTDLKKTIFENCVFNGVDFEYSDLGGLCLDDNTFIDVKFHNAALNEVSFIGATLKNVSFRAPYALTNRYYRAIKTICFDGANLDKLTYASLKGIGADLGSSRNSGGL